MKMKYKLMRLQFSMIEYKEILLKECDMIQKILNEIENMLHWEVSHSMMFHWWIAHESEISVIETVITRVKNNKTLP